ncbi:glycosyltransferase [Acuticoccus sediminis]|uniref:glycosyltransferase n=1 Tax=Acuticoccus sediminis TaxID=2184697 RepID=UPI001CFE8156|nr:glycosyltransferase [Acuticoccus sediminis]
MDRIAILAHSHPVISTGGGEVAAYREFRSLLRDGHDAVFVAMTNDAGARDTLFPGGQTIVEVAPNEFILTCDAFDNFSCEWLDLTREATVLAFLRGLGAEVYHFHHFWNFGASLIANLRAALPEATFVLTLHEFLAICAADGQMVKQGSRQLCMAAAPVDCAVCTRSPPIDFVIRKARFLAMFDCFDIIVSPSHFLKQRFVDWGLADDAVHVLDNGLPVGDASAFDLSLADRSRKFAFFGQATPTKGLDVLLDAVGLLNGTLETPVSVDIYGVSQKRFEDFWPGMAVPDGVRFRGRYQASDAVALMKQFGWIVIPSVWWENSPVVIQEARAAGVPMIASRLGGVLEKTTGWSLHFAPGDPVDLARVMGSVAGDTDALERLSAQITPPLDVVDFNARLAALIDRHRSRLVAAQ